MTDTVIKVENLGKKYIIAHHANERYTVLRDIIAKKTKSIFQNIISGNKIELTPSKEDFWALKDVSFEVKQGEVIGVIGRNGAGKSTLLKILSRITEPTIGKFKIKGRVASLLEVGTGFHQELTGRENIFLNGAILGMTRQEIKQNFDEIIDFAEIDKFLDTPVKRYSSGMYVRLAFAVAAHLEPEILLVDEVLAVGDVEFQKKCLGKMGKISKEGRTIIFISHNMGAIANLTSCSILLEKGHIIKHGPTNQIIEKYLSSSFTSSAVWNVHQYNNNPIQILNVRMHSSDKSKSISEFGTNNDIFIEIKYVVRHLVRSSVIAVNIHAFDGTHLISLEDTDKNNELLSKRLTGVYITTVKLPSTWLNSGSYLLRVGCGILHVEVYDNIEALSFTIIETGDPTTRGHRKGYLLPMLQWVTNISEDNIKIFNGATTH